MSVVRVYMRPGCHLCEEAETALRPLVAASGDTLEFVDIESDDALHRRFLELIPVIERDGVEIARLDQFRDGRLERTFAGA